MCIESLYPGGVTETSSVGDCIGQGTAGAALVSQVNLDLGLMDYFKDSNEEISYGGVRLQPMAYQDDIMRSSKDVLSTQVGNTKLAVMFEENGLEAHPDKTCFIVCGSRRFKEKVEHDLKRNPLMFDSFLSSKKSVIGIWDRCYTVVVLICAQRLQLKRE